jgi:cystathionine beta-lyase/cystathionine gamma-synthase
MENFEPFPHFATLAIHHGQDAEQWAGNPVVPPISLATTFKQEEPGKHAVCVSFLANYGRNILIIAYNSIQNFS